MHVPSSILTCGIFLLPSKTLQPPQTEKSFLKGLLFVFLTLEEVHKHTHSRNDRKESVVRKGLRAPVTRLEKQKITVTVFIKRNYSLGEGLQNMLCVLVCIVVWDQMPVIPVDLDHVGTLGLIFGFM